jgi:predicted MFS family arabinose efflux permease
VARAAIHKSAAYALGLLTLVSFFNYLDRMVLAVVLQPIKHDLHLSDTQLGLISGLAFALLYATFGLPLARLADKTARVRILSASLVLWSAFTAATGLARTFVQIFFVRVGVGIGEAGCVPAAHSMLGDLFPPARRAFAISTFQAGGLAGLSAGLFFTGLVADHFGWRVALTSVGLPGLPLAALLLFTVPEPHRPLQSSDGPEAFWTALGSLLRRPALLHLVLALSIGGFGTYGIVQWIPTFLIRSHHMSLSEVGLWSGLSAGVAGIAGVLTGGAVSARLIRHDGRWELWYPALAYGLGGPLYGLALFAPDASGAVALIALAAFVAASGGGVALSAIQSFAEPHRRATAIALVLFLSSVLGLGIGPLAVGLISDRLAPIYASGSLRYALLIAVVAMVWAALHFWRAAGFAARDRIVQGAGA